MKRLLLLAPLLAVVVGCSTATHQTAASSHAKTTATTPVSPHRTGPTAVATRPTHTPTTASSGPAATRQTAQPTSGAAQPHRSTGPVVRDGHTADPVVPAAAASFTQNVSYSDGIKVAITGVKQETATGTGAGMRPGEAVTKFAIRLSNGSQSPVRLDQVVVTVTFDNGSMQAEPLYANGSEDFSGQVSPGGSATATYAFTIPQSALGSVVMTVDFDGTHSAATFQGPVR